MDMKEEDQIQFMKEMGGIPSQANIRVKAEELMDRYARLEDTFSEGGAYLPLTVWAAKGFDAEAIEAKTLPEDIMTHAVLGTVYRVRILAKSKNGAKGWMRTNKLLGDYGIKKRQKKDAAAASGSQGQLALAAAPAAEAGDQEEEPHEDAGMDEDGDNGSEDSDSSDSSSSSSSSDEKGKSKKEKKKAKKAKKAKKEKKKAKKAAKKEKKAAAAAKKKAREDEKTAKAEAKKARAPSCRSNRLPENSNTWELISN